MDTRTPCPCTSCGHTSQHPDAASHASCFGYRSNELLKAFERLRVLYYEDTIAADWEWSGPRGTDRTPVVTRNGAPRWSTPPENWG